MNALEQFIEFAGERRSIRKFQNMAVPQEILESLVQAATWAPSASNRQDWEFVVVSSPSIKMKMAETVRSRWRTLIEHCGSECTREALEPYRGNFDWFATAPVLILVTSKRPESFLVDLLNEDLAVRVGGSYASAILATQNLILAAHAAGLGTCCLTGPVAAEDALRDLLGIKRTRRLACLVALGYSAEEPTPSPRKPIEEITRYVE